MPVKWRTSAMGNRRTPRAGSWMTARHRKFLQDGSGSVPGGAAVRAAGAPSRRAPLAGEVKLAGDADQVGHSRAPSTPRSAAGPRSLSKPCQAAIIARHARPHSAPRSAGSSAGRAAPNSARRGAGKRSHPARDADTGSNPLDQQRRSARRRHRLHARRQGLRCAVGGTSCLSRRTMR
jgi:hypothetical protein